MPTPNPRDRHTEFSEIYRAEALQSRRDRSRRAFFWARIAGLALMLTIGATLRSEPELRSALARAGMDAVMATAGRSQPDPRVAQISASEDLPTSRIKVNRFGSSSGTSETQVDAQALAQELGRAMDALKVME